MWSIIVMTFVIINGHTVAELRVDQDQFATYQECDRELRRRIQREGPPEANEIVACARAGQGIEA